MANADRPDTLPSTPASAQGTAVLADQARRWAAGEAVQVEEYLAQNPQLRTDVSAILDLICHEIVLRERYGGKPELQEYVARFPELAAELNLQFQIDGLVAQAAGSTNEHRVGLSLTASERMRHRDETRTYLQMDGREPRTTPTATAAGRYEIGEELARGGMGVVYRATDRTLGREVAVKLLAPRLRGTTAAARFFDEARLTGRLQHPGIPPVHDVGTLPDGSPFLAMKLIRGRTLADLLSSRGAGVPEVGRFLPVFEHICHAVGYAHAQGVIHRDLKPSNVMVGEFGEVQVMDWGLAKEMRHTEPGPGNETRVQPNGSIPQAEVGVTKSGVTLQAPELPRESHGNGLRSPEARTVTGAVIGTPAYMAPEQARGEPTDERSDVFALGGILSTILTGKPPNSASSPAEAVRQCAAGDVTDTLARLDACGADSELVALAKRCLNPDANARPTDAGAVASLVHAYRAGVEGRLRKAEAERAAADVRAHEQRRRRRWQLAAAVAAVAVVGLIATGAWWQDRVKRRQAESDARQAESDAEQARLETAALVHAQTDRDRQTRNGVELEGLLADAEAALKGDNAIRARLPLEQAEKRAREGGAERIAARLTRCRAEFDMLTELDRIDELSWDTEAERSHSFDREVRLWRDAFDRYGIVPGTTPVAEAARRVNESLVRDRVLGALDVWLGASQSPEILAILQAADPDEFRGAVRSAMQAGNQARCRELGESPAALEQPPRFAIVLGHLHPIPELRQAELLEAAAERRPGDFGVLMALGSLYIRKTWGPVGPSTGAARPFQEEDAKLAEKWTRAALAARPERASAHVTLAMLYLLGGDASRAIPILRRACDLDPRSSIAHNNLGHALREVGKLEEAIAEYRESIRLDARAHAAHYNLGRTLWDLGDKTGAIASFREAVRIVPDYALAQMNLGVALHNTGKPAEAVVAFREAIRVEPEDPALQHLLGRALYDLHDPLGAVAAFRKSISLDPKNPKVHFALGFVLYELKEHAEAVNEFFQAAKLDPKWAMAHHNLGYNLYKIGDVDRAITAYTISLKLDPKYAPGHFNLGEAHLQKKELDKALAAYREAIRLDEKYVDAHFQMGYVLYLKKDHAAAVAPFRKAASLNPKNYVAHYNLGFNLQKTGDLDGAIKAYEDALRVKPDYTAAQKYLALARQEKAARVERLAPPPHEPKK